MYRSKREPRLKQAEAAAKMRGRRVFALLMAMRTGKTKVGVDDWGEMVEAREVGDLLIVAPGGAYLTWIDEIRKDLPDSIGAEVFAWRSSRRDPASLGKFMSSSDRPRILLVNVEAISSVKEARDVCENFLARRRGVLDVDESVIIKNPSATRTKFIIEKLAPLAAYRRIMSGLPTPRSPLDLFSQFYFLDPKILGFKNYYSFRAHHAIMRDIVVGRRRVPIVVGYRNVDELWDKIEPHSFRCKLEDCYDLPPSDYSFRDVEMTKEQRRIYDDIKKFATAELEGHTHVTATEVVTQMLRMHQVLCGHVRDESGGWHDVPENRTGVLLDLLDDYDGKAIIWCSYDRDVRKVSEILARHFDCRVARFWGGNQSIREDEERMFKNDPGCPFMVATAAAGGRGRTWDVADLVVYYSNTDDLDHRMQSEERPKSVDKKKPIAYVDLRVPGSVDDKIIGALRKKINLADAITGDNWRSWLV